MIVFANVLQPLIDLSESILKFFHDQVGFGWGASIIAMTVVIRLAILPLTFKGVVGMQQMQRLQPEIKKLQERYKDDRQRMQQETMRLYKEHKVNPLGSCLPLALQIPFFIALFYLLRGEAFNQDIHAIPGAERFLFIPDLGDPATGWVLAVLVVLYIGTQLGASLVSLATADKTQKRIFLALPFVFVLFILNFPTGLIVYWITTNLWTVGQQLLVKKIFPKPEPIDSSAEPDSKPARGKPAAGRALNEQAGGADGANGGGKRAKKAPVAAGNGGPAKAPPPSPRKKKKKSGRRR